MFQEGEWEEGAAPAPPRPPPQAPPGALAPSGPRQRLRLLATLRRLQGSGGPQGTLPGPPSPAPPPDPEEDGGRAEEEEEERGPRRKRRKRKPRQRRQGEGEEQPPAPPGARKGPQQQQQQQQQGGRGGAAALAPRAEPVACSRSPGSEEGAPTKEGPLLSRKQWRNRQKNKRRTKNKFKAPGEAPAATGGVPADGPRPPAPAEPPGSPGGGEGGGAAALPEDQGGRGAALRLRMEERLQAARFRFLNQQLYSRPSQEAGQLFREDPQAFAVYHQGFARQMERWPEKPVQRLVRYLRHRPASLVVADFGCGDCTLARSVRNPVHCFDLEALDPRVNTCDMSQVPLADESVDVAVFCLALMGTNLREILGEASRVLRLGGALLVAEVGSRFRDVGAFVGALSALGFSLRSKDVSGSHFYSFEFCKVKPLPAKAKPLPGLALRPCLYKRR